MKRSRSTAHRITARIRKKRNKKDDEYVSVDDFIKATGLIEWDVQRPLDMLTCAGSASIIIN